MPENLLYQRVEMRVGLKALTLTYGGPLSSPTGPHNPRTGRLQLMLERMAVVAQAGGDEAEARRLFEDSGTWYRQVSRSLNLLGHLALTTGDPARARERFNQTLETAVAVRIITGALDGLTGLAMLYAQEGNHEGAPELASHILPHPASTQEAKDRVERLPHELISLILPLSDLEQKVGPYRPTFCSVLQQVVLKERSSLPL